MAAGLPRLVLSLIVPARDEQESVAPLLEEVDRVLDGLDLPGEVIVVDDGSTDRTLSALRELLPRHRRLRVLTLSRGRQGQSAAFAAGFAAAGGEILATMDADGQNDPADLPALLEVVRRGEADLAQGDRTARRCDSTLRRLSSSVAWRMRRWWLGDTVRDTGCSLRVMRREVADALPLHLAGMHRFIPGTARHLGFRVLEIPVNHRPRRAGRTKYGVWNRAWPGLIDLLGVRWMHRRGHEIAAREVDATTAEPSLAAPGKAPS